MARRSSIIRVSVVGDASDLQRAFQQAERSAQGFGQSMSQLGDRMTRNVTLPLAAGFTAAFKASEQQARAEAQLNNVLRSTGGIAGITADHVKDLAANLQQTTTFGDETTIMGANLLLTFKNLRNEAGNGNDVFDRTTKVMLDMSTAMDQDLKSSAIQLGKALNDPIQGIAALSRVGITFSDDQKAMIRSLQESGDLLGAQKIILSELESQFQGSAEAVAQTAGGQLTQAMNALGDAAEVIGTSVAPVVIEVAEGIKAAAESFQELPDSLQEGIVKFGLLLAAAGPVLSIVGRLITAYKNLRVAILGVSAVSAIGGLGAGAGAAAGAGTVAAVRASATMAAANTLGGAAVTAAGGVAATQGGLAGGRAIASALGDPFNTQGRRAAAEEAGFEEGFFFSAEVKQFWSDVASDVWGFFTGSEEAGDKAASASSSAADAANNFEARVAALSISTENLNPELEETNQLIIDMRNRVAELATAQGRFNDEASQFNEDGTLNAARLLAEVGVSAASSVDGLLRLKAAIEALRPGSAEATGAPILEPGVSVPATTGARPNALGGRYRAGELLIAGEVGPEVMMPDHDGTMIPNRHLRAASGGGGTIINHFHGLMTREMVREIDRQLEQLRGGRVA